MKLRVIAKYANGSKSGLLLAKEKKNLVYGEVFEILDEVRADEILNAKFNGYPVAELVEEVEQEPEQEPEQEQEPVQEPEQEPVQEPVQEEQEEQNKNKKKK